MKKRSPKPEALAKQISASTAEDGPPGQTAGGAGTAAGRAGAPEWPDICGNFDIRIDRDGVWFYQGSPIGRLPMVKLFATVLRRDAEGAFWLVTPVEAGRIEVEDAPFVAVELQASGKGRQQVVTLRTNLDHIVTVDAAHPIRVDQDPATGEPRPYVTVRDGLEARILRSVFYHLVELGVDAPADLAATAGQVIGVWSAADFFPLGRLDDGPLGASE